MIEESDDRWGPLFELEGRCNRIQYVTALMTVTQTYRAVIADLGLPHDSEVMCHVADTLYELSETPVHGKRDWMREQAWKQVLYLLRHWRVIVADKSLILFNGNTFELVRSAFDKDYAYNLRIAEGTAK